MTAPAQTRPVNRQLRCIDRDYEAASGDLLPGDVEPIYISRRATGEDVIVLHGHVEARVLVCRVHQSAPEFTLDDIVGLFVRTYLGTLTGGSLRGDFDRVEVRGGPLGATAVFEFPSDEVLFG